jgi:hypothetical protein
MNPHCRLCGKPFETIRRDRTPGSHNYVVLCRRCGEYEANDDAWDSFADMGTTPVDRHLLSALARTAPFRQVGRVLIDASSFVAVREGRIREPTLVERREAVLDWVAFESRRNPQVPSYGALVRFDPSSDYPVAYCRPLERDWSEWNFVIQPLLERALIVAPENGALRITEKGWEMLETRPRANGSVGFVAMKFQGMDQLYKAIAEGIERAGYKPTRIDREEYIGGVMDQIIAKIRDSRFVVADFTGNRGGVYYEAGVAFGLNLPVFTLCQKDHLEPGLNRVHFDVQHLNLLTWEEDKLAELTDRLEARIVAVLGRGPVTRPKI